MTIRTLIVGYEPDYPSSLGSRYQRDQEYLDSLLKEFDVGELHFAGHDNFQERIDAIDPFIAVVFDESRAQAVRAYKKDVLIYLTDSPNRIFYRKAEMEERKTKQRSIFREIAGFVEHVRRRGEEELMAARRYASMTFQDKYKMVVQALTGEREDLRQKTWELLNRNDVDPDFIWIRAKIIIEVWEKADEKSREEFMRLAEKRRE